MNNLNSEAGYVYREIYRIMKIKGFTIAPNFIQHRVSVANRVDVFHGAFTFKAQRPGKTQLTQSNNLAFAASDACKNYLIRDALIGIPTLQKCV